MQLIRQGIHVQARTFAKLRKPGARSHGLAFRTRGGLSCCSFAANAVRLQLHALAYNLANFMRT
ncbi:MAG TPA: hypothetical protein VGA01_07440, partial [Candidatus Binatia bacterium]